MTDQKTRAPRPTQRAPQKKRVADVASLQTYLDTLGLSRPSIHVNGTGHPTAVITVDLGSPLGGQRLAQEQSQELVSRLRRTTRDLYKDDMNIRVSFDNNNGIFWSSVA
jgi:hypothetical protein